MPRRRAGCGRGAPLGGRCRGGDPEGLCVRVRVRVRLRMRVRVRVRLRARVRVEVSLRVRVRVRAGCGRGGPLGGRCRGGPVR